MRQRQSCRLPQSRRGAMPDRAEARFELASTRPAARFSPYRRPAPRTTGRAAGGPGQEETYYACSACHSIRLVAQQRLPRRRWDHLLDWMVEKQGMAELPAADRALILDYLTGHLNPDVPR